MGLFEWEDVFIVAFESSVGKRENVHCWWASVGGGGRDGFGVGYEGGLSIFGVLLEEVIVSV